MKSFIVLAVLGLILIPFTEALKPLNGGVVNGVAATVNEAAVGGVVEKPTETVEGIIGGVVEGVDGTVGGVVEEVGETVSHLFLVEYAIERNVIFHSSKDLFFLKLLRHS